MICTENERLQIALQDLEKEKVEQNEKSNKELDDLKQNHQKQLDKINKQYESKTKELERIVVKYAMSEKQILDAQKLRDDFERKLKDTIKDKDTLLTRIKALTNDKQSLINQVDSKVNEITNVQKELDKLRKQFKEKDAQLMQFEFKLNKEQDNQIETNKKLETTLKQIDELTKELAIYRDDKSTDVEMTSVNKLDLENKCKEIVDLRTRNSELEDQNQLQSERIKKLESENAKFEDDQKRLKDVIDELKKEFIVFNEKLESNKLLKIDYDLKVNQLEQLTDELNNLRKENEEMITESKAYRQKEGELLEFTDRLQTKTVQLQSEHNHFKQRCIELESKFNEFNEQISKQNDELNEMKNELKASKDQHDTELNLFAKKLAEESNSKEQLKREREELENENKIMKKKHLQSVKELNKELASLRKKIERYEQNHSNEINQHQKHQTSNEKISLSSRTDSSNSLERTSSNGIGLNEQLNQQDNSAIDTLISTPMNNHQILNPNFTSQNDIVQQLDKNVLLNKILALQQQLSKLRSRIEFLEEHNATLLGDIKKKSKLIQNFILREQAGILSSNDMDNFKVFFENLF